MGTLPAARFATMLPPMQMNLFHVQMERVSNIMGSEMFTIFFCSSNALPKYYVDLMTDPNSPLRSFYPKGITSYYVMQNKSIQELPNA